MYTYTCVHSFCVRQGLSLTNRWCDALFEMKWRKARNRIKFLGQKQEHAMCCSALQCVAVCCSKGGLQDEDSIIWRYKGLRSAQTSIIECAKAFPLVFEDGLELTQMHTCAHSLTHTYRNNLCTRAFHLGSSRADSRNSPATMVPECIKWACTLLRRYTNMSADHCAVVRACRSRDWGIWVWFKVWGMGFKASDVAKY